MTDTPETDAITEQCQRQINIPTNPVPAEFARRLERERDEAREQVREEQRLHIQTLDERDEARQWESQAIVARIQRDEFLKTLGEVREILCEALPNENQLTSSMAVKLVRERDQAARLVRRLLRSHWEKSSRRSVNARSHWDYGWPAMIRMTYKVTDRPTLNLTKHDNATTTNTR